MAFTNHTFKVGGIAAVTILALIAVGMCMVLGWTVEALWNTGVSAAVDLPEITWAQASCLVGLFVIWKFLGAALTTIAGPKTKPAVIVMQSQPADPSLGDPHGTSEKPEPGKNGKGQYL